MPDIRDELQRVEDGIRKLKVQYELYLVGAEKVPPTKLHEEIDKLVKKFSIMNFQRSGDRFYFNNILNRYNAYSELWNKQLRNREEGRTPSGRPIRTGSGGAAVRAGSGSTLRSAGAAGARMAADDAVRVRIDRLEETALRRLYDRFGAARTQAGQLDAMPAFERFRDQIKAQLEALRQKGVSGEVEFRVSAQDSKVSLKARTLK
jgi:hypothetical protein